MNHKTQKSGKPMRELLNGAFVAVPANPEARVLASKANKIDRVDFDNDGNITVKLADEQKDAANWRDNQTDAINDMFEAQPERKEYWQGVHDVAVKLGAGCPYSDPQAVPDVLNGVGNRSVSDAETKSSPTESTEEPTATTADEAAEAAEESAEDMALLGKSLAIKLRNLSED
jgi:hypothetical protein